MLRIFRWTLVLLALAALLVALGVRWLTGHGLPRREGTARLAPLSAPVEVRWDGWGVPHLEGERQTDLAAAQGYLHANDRITQMELWRRAVAGRLSELFGEVTLEADREARMLRLRESGERLWAAAGPETRGWLEAYAAGVNAWLEERGTDLPPTLVLLGVRPEPWTPVDSLGVVLLMGRQLSFWQGRPEERRFAWLGRQGVARTLELIGDEPVHLPADLEELARDWAAERDEQANGDRAAAGAPEGRRARSAARARGRQGDGTASADSGGSNNWALGAGRTAGSAAIVASDPHLPLRLPGFWYQLSLRAPELEAAGMTLPGLPGVVIGRGAHVAWALTNVMLDDHDLLLEELSADGRSVRRGDGWAAVRSERHAIAVRGAEPVEIELLSTDRGPLLAADPGRGLPPRTLLWTCHRPGDPLSAFLRLARARRVTEIEQGIAGYVCPAQNLVAGDAEGGLLQTVLGRPPLRRTGDGRLPVPGWDPAYGWDGIAPRTDVPTTLDPPDGMLVTANHDVRPPGWEGTLTADFDLPFRADRIRDLLASRTEWRPRAMGGIQTDVRSLYALRVVELVAQVEPAAGRYEGAAGRAFETLSAWDGAMTASGPAALFTLFESRLFDLAFADEVDVAGVHHFEKQKWLVRLLEGRMSPAWLDDAATPSRESRPAALERALAGAWESGVERWGDDVARWPYGELHRLRIPHPLGSLPLLGRWLDRGPFALAGSASTVAAFGGPWDGERRPIVYGPSMRWIAEPGGDDALFAVLPGGQSGHPFDPHYADQLGLYLTGELRPVPWSRDAVREATVSVLRLRSRPAP